MQYTTGYIMLLKTDTIRGMVRHIQQMWNEERREHTWQKKKPNAVAATAKKSGQRRKYKDLINRLSRIEGQIRGIKRMLDEDCYCPDIITQVAAANAALNSFNKVLLANHIKTCVADDIRAGKDETIDELLNTLQKLMK